MHELAVYMLTLTEPRPNGKNSSIGSANRLRTSVANHNPQADKRIIALTKTAWVS